VSKAIAESIEIEAPPEKVWEVIMDPHRLGEWVTTHEAIEDAPSGGLEEGSEFQQKLRLAGKSFTVAWTVTECRRPELARWEGKGPGGAVARVRYALEQTGDGTRFDYENEFELPGGMLGRVASGLLSAAPGRREARRTLENLKRTLEDA
jgi:carbon monoxide dehydrogenase subunit G